MYVTTNSGLGARRKRRGFGDLNCPGDAGCPGNVQPVDSGNVCDTTSKMFDATICNNLYAGTSASTFTAWMNANGTLLAVGAGALLLLAFMGRR